MNSSGDIYVDLNGLFINAISTGIILAFVIIVFMIVFKRKGREGRYYN